MAAPEEDAGESETFSSTYLGDVTVLTGIDIPSETEKRVLPFMEENAALFRGKTVLEIGSRSGLIALHAAKLGAAKVVAQDSNASALRNVEQNAASHGLASAIETRQAPRDDLSPYSTVGSGERFDVIIAEPPDSLDLDAPWSSRAVDNGELGPSIVRGLERHLAERGVALLLYNSLFYHQALVKLARHEGYDVRDHGASKMTPEEAEALFNSYLSRFLAREGVALSAFRFDRNEDRLGCAGIKTDLEPLVPGNSERPYYGMIVIRRGDGQGGVAPEPPSIPFSDDGTFQGESTTFRSLHFDEPLVLLSGVFPPREAESRILPFMKENATTFEGKSVLEIGTGTGVIGLYAAKLGATTVVATDINREAIRNVAVNAERQGLAAIVEARLVPPDDTSAYSVIAPDESFDVIISNPPYSLDLDAPNNTAVADAGDLGPSIVHGLDRHLKPEGLAILYYNSLFYHHVMAKFARHAGYQVRNHDPSMMTPVETAAIYNSYLSRLLEREGIDRDAFRFVRNRDHLGCFGLGSPPEPLLPGGSNRTYPGMLAIWR